MWTDFYNNCKYHHNESCSNFSEYWVTLRTVLGLSHVSIFSGGGVMWGCSHGSVQWYERAGCDIVHIAEWEWPWRMITGQCGECLVRCHDASDSSDTGWLCNTSEAGHSPGPGQWRLNTEVKCQCQNKQTSQIFSFHRQQIPLWSPESCCHHLLWSSTAPADLELDDEQLGAKYDVRRGGGY